MSKGAKAKAPLRKRQTAAKSAFKKKLKVKANNDQLRDFLDQQSSSIHQASMAANQKSPVIPDFTELHKNKIQPSSLNELASILQGM